MHPDGASYMAVLEACGRAGQPERALQVLDEMQSRGLRPDGSVFGTIMKAVASSPGEQLPAFQGASPLGKRGATSENIPGFAQKGNGQLQEFEEGDECEGEGACEPFSALALGEIPSDGKAGRQEVATPVTVAEVDAALLNHHSGMIDASVGDRVDGGRQGGWTRGERGGVENDGDKVGDAGQANGTGGKGGEGQGGEGHEVWQEARGDEADEPLTLASLLQGVEGEGGVVGVKRGEEDCVGCEGGGGVVGVKLGEEDCVGCGEGRENGEADVGGGHEAKARMKDDAKTTMKDDARREQKGSMLLSVAGSSSPPASPFVMSQGSITFASTSREASGLFGGLDTNDTSQNVEDAIPEGDDTFHEGSRDCSLGIKGVQSVDGTVHEEGEGAGGEGTVDAGGGETVEGWLRMPHGAEYSSGYGSLSVPHTILAGPHQMGGGWGAAVRDPFVQELIGDVGVSELECTEDRTEMTTGVLSSLAESDDDESKTDVGTEGPECLSRFGSIDAALPAGLPRSREDSPSSPSRGHLDASLLVSDSDEASRSDDEPQHLPGAAEDVEGVIIQVPLMKGCASGQGFPVGVVQSAGGSHRRSLSAGDWEEVERRVPAQGRSASAGMIHMGVRVLNDHGEDVDEDSPRQERPGSDEVASLRAGEASPVFGESPLMSLSTGSQGRPQPPPRRPPVPGGGPGGSPYRYGDVVKDDGHPSVGGGEGHVGGGARKELGQALDATAARPMMELHIDDSCPDCKRTLDEGDLRRGWMQDEQLYTTQCPYCPRKFVARFTVVSNRPDGKDLSCECLSPLVVRKEVQNLMRAPSIASDWGGAEGAWASGRQPCDSVEDKSVPLFVQHLRSKQPAIFWNIVWHFIHCKLPLSFILIHEDATILSKSATPACGPSSQVRSRCMSL